MLRIGVFSDTHVGRNIPRIVGDARRHAFREAFKQAIDIFIDNQVDYVIHGGDLFEKRSMTPEDVVFVKDEFYRLTRVSREKHGKNVKILIVRGNHDGTPSSCVLEYITHPLADYLQIVGESIKEELRYYEDDSILAVGLGYHPFIKKKIEDQLNNLAGIVESHGDGKFKILLLHNYVEEIHDIPPHTPDHSVAGLDDLQKINVDMVVLGHYHERSELRKVGNLLFLIPGATEAVDLAEKGPFGVSILDIGCEKEVEEKFIELTPSQYISFKKVTSEEPKPFQWFRQRVLEEVSIFIDELRVKNIPGILKIRVSGVVIDADPFMRILAEEEIGRIKEKNPFILYLEVDENMTPIIRGRPMEGASMSREDIFKDLLEELGQEPGLVELIEEASIALEEKASEKTGLLKDSDRAVFIDKWLKILMSKTEKR
ncbi:MAG: metallophosphoesterase family protein [Nitrososphaerota archaeon]